MILPAKRSAPLAPLLLVAIAIAARPPALPSRHELPSAAYLAALPDGELKRRFILDCTGCHTFRDRIPYPEGRRRTEAAWREAIARMVSQYGPQSAFPVIGPDRDPGVTAAWLYASMPQPGSLRWDWPAGLEGRAEFREYLLPAPADLPHDLGVTGGEVVVTGMFTARMYVLDPETGVVRTEATPAPNPRAVEIGGDGEWWVVLGAPRRVARRSANGEWQTWDAGFYAHSVALTPDGGVWVNGHFTHAPELVRRIDPATGAQRDLEVPAHPSLGTSPVPYEIRAARDGSLWLSELQGNRLVRLDPATGAVKTWEMPTAWSGPRRLDVASDGTVWIPQYAANRIARFDPRTEQFTEIELPIRDAAPYIVRYDERRDVVWIGTGAADAVLRYDPATGAFTGYRLPAPDQMVRHLALDPATGDLWIAPGSSPGTVPSRVVRLRPKD